ncbi:MAG: Crp/Fnr family transcriptional regulator [Chitinophagaceae bacterium]|jgi:CRP-like cAMP-binding protein|nr:Crp/Fnr family transcriptional regulator [Chitinophagaceae bacterium]MBK7680003.1 Crp/Fnr family transcriptional regulator [Chitinophagaceae bacterium]MBK9465689.1 Crp/Fnr family transcriptional regulator [Chitinophagaceae bacterium]MBK9937712.1 Crp/Fnr family transcriptional regulator [Chitinophagaceae bacterium]
MIEPLLERLNKFHPLNAALTERISSATNMVTYHAGDYILKEGQVCNKACLVIKGLARSYYIKEDKDITSRFMDEGFIITSWISYYTQQPGNEFIEALEETTLACINYADIQKMYTDFPEFNIVGRKQAEYGFFMAEQRTQILRKHTAEEKYKFFLSNHPTLLQRVALKHIATYLGMNEETLSRVRSKFHRKKD